MIYTVTFSPSLRTRTSRQAVYQPGDEQILAGGKGINVSIVLNNLGPSNASPETVASFGVKEIIAN